MNDVLTWIQTYAAALGTIGALAAGLFPLIQYLLAKSAENRNHEFNNYHQVLKDLIDPTTPRLDRQVASIFELRNFKNYFPVSIRILEGLRVDWDQPTTKPRLIKEIDLTIKYMKNKTWCSRE